MTAAKSREADGVIMNDLAAAFYMKQFNERSFYVARRLQSQDLTILVRNRNTTSWFRDVKHAMRRNWIMIMGLVSRFYISQQSTR